MSTRQACAPDVIADLKDSVTRMRENTDGIFAAYEAAEAENERLRELLAIAREGLGCGLSYLRYYGGPYAQGIAAVSAALRRSDPDVQPESGE